MSNAKRFGISLIVGLMVTSCSLSPQVPEAVAPTSSGDTAAATPLGNNAVTLCNGSLTLQVNAGQPVPKVPDQPRPTKPVYSGGGC